MLAAWPRVGSLEQATINAGTFRLRLVFVRQVGPTCLISYIIFLLQKYIFGTVDCVIWSMYTTSFVMKGSEKWLLFLKRRTVPTFLASRPYFIILSPVSNRVFMLPISVSRRLLQFPEHPPNQTMPSGYL